MKHPRLHSWNDSSLRFIDRFIGIIIKYVKRQSKFILRVRFLGKNTKRTDNIFLPCFLIKKIKLYVTKPLKP